MTANTDFHMIVDYVFETTRRWAGTSTDYLVDPATKLLTGVLDDKDGLDYAVSSVDGVIRPEDQDIAARRFGELDDKNPKFLPWYLHAPAPTDGKAGRLLPGSAVSAACKVFVRLAGSLVADVTDEKLGPAVERLCIQGTRLSVDLLDETVFGKKEVRRRPDDTRRLLEHPGIDYVSLKVSAVTDPHNPWGCEQVVGHVVSQLLSLYQYAAKAGGKLINLGMEEYRDLYITIGVLKEILDREECLGLRADIILQAYLPGTPNTMRGLQGWTAARKARGGTPIKV